MSEDKTFYTNTIPSKENILSEVLKGAIDGTLPEKVNMKSLATERIYVFLTSPAFGDRKTTRLNKGMDYGYEFHHLFLFQFQLIFYKVHNPSWNFHAYYFILN